MSQKIDYSAVDAAIIAAVMTGCHRLVNFEHDTGIKNAVREVDDQLPKNRLTGQTRAVHRTIDARLQALKRDGKLVFLKKAGWRLKPSHTASK